MSCCSRVLTPIGCGNCWNRPRARKKTETAGGVLGSCRPASTRNTGKILTLRQSLSGPFAFLLAFFVLLQIRSGVESELPPYTFCDIFHLPVISRCVGLHLAYCFHLFVDAHDARCAYVSYRHSADGPLVYSQAIRVENGSVDSRRRLPRACQIT